MPALTPRDADLAKAVAANPLWYHTIDVAPGVTTPGWFDLRPVLDRIPWPDVRGARCLDVGTYDGFLAFELERRGAAAVVATDIARHEDWDWPVRDRARGAAYLAAAAGAKGRGFEIAAAALGSQVERRFVSVYDLPAAGLGTFDVVVCGSLLLHLRDPLRALDAIRRVCAGQFLSIETIDATLGLASPRRPALHLSGHDGQWLIPNRAGHLRMLDLAGFDVVECSRPFPEPHGPSHPTRRKPWRHVARRLLHRAYLGGHGVGTHAVLTRRADLAAAPG